MRVRHTGLWSCAHVRAPWIRAGGRTGKTWKETVLQTLAVAVQYRLVPLCWDRGSQRSQLRSVRSPVRLSMTGPNLWSRLVAVGACGWTTAVCHGV
jgi:hypothetical protein